MLHKVWLLDRTGGKINCKSVNGALGYELTAYVINPRFIEEKLNEEMDTAQITLENYPQANCFEPKTKVIIERWDDNGNMNLPYFHMLMQNDNVESYVGLPGYYTHRLDLVEASAIAQGYHVDNIAVTYELQDIDLNYDINIDLDSKAANSYHNENDMPEGNASPASSPFWTQELEGSWSYANGLGAMKSYTPDNPWVPGNNPTVVWNRKENEDYKWITGVRSYKFMVEGNYGDIRKNYLSEVGETKKITLNIPKIRCYKAVENNASFKGTYYTPSNYKGEGYHNENAYGTWESLTYCETITTITVTDATTKEIIDTIEHTYKPQSSSDISQEYYAQGVERYKNSSPSNTYNAPLYWGLAKGKIKLCSAGNEEGETYELGLKGNRIYSIQTELNTEDRQGSIYSRIEVFTGAKIPINPFDVHNYAEFTLKERNFGRPYSKIEFQTSPDLVLSGTPILRTPAKYNLLNCLKKAILSTGSFHKIDGVPVLDTPTAFVIDPKHATKLQTTPINETVFYEKNLWEVCSSIGYYIHAIPYIEFYSNEQFLISFRELGKNTLSTVENKKITVFNSKDIEEYYGTLDSYVKNLYSPENIIDENISFKTESNNYLISNDTAGGETSERILQIKEFYIVNKEGIKKNALSFIVEKSIYDTFSLDYERVPSKANTIYYTLDTNLIQGMTATIPLKNNENNKPPYPIQALIGRLFEIENKYSIKVNDYFMRIVYNTTDTTRIKQVRPNINNMLLNSTFDEYPVHEQFYGQEARIIDSERYGNLLYGELLKTGNEYYQMDEWNEVGAVKEVGDITPINGSYYYISQVESEWYDNAVFQRVTYHKDFNAISKIISIPSEPRFYEIANTSIVDRSPYSFENIMITTAPPGELPESLKANPKYLSKDKFGDLIKGWLFGVAPSYPDYAITTFRDDPDTHGDGYSKMFVDTPKIEEAGQQLLTDKVISQNKVLTYSSQNSLIFEWGMADNFSAGSFVDTRIIGNTYIEKEGDKEKEQKLVNGAYYGLNFLRYCDLYGRVDIMDFALVNNDAHDIDSVRRLPQKVCSDSVITNAAVTDKGRILNKDNREGLKSISFQVNLITDQNIYFGRAIWRKKERPVKILLLDNEISKFSFQNLNTDVQAKVLAAVEATPNCRTTTDGFVYVEVTFHIPDAIIDNVSCIAIVDGGDKDDSAGGMPYIYKNVKRLSSEQKRHSFFIATVK